MCNGLQNQLNSLYNQFGIMIGLWAIGNHHPYQIINIFEKIGNVMIKMFQEGCWS